MHISSAKSYIFPRRIHRGKKSSTATLHALPLTERINICTVKAWTPCIICCLCNEGFLDGLPSNGDSKLATKTQPKYFPIFFSSFTKSTNLESEAILCAFQITVKENSPGGKFWVAGKRFIANTAIKITEKTAFKQLFTNNGQLLCEHSCDVAIKR